VYPIIITVEITKSILIIMQSSGSESSSPVLKSENNGATQVDCSGRAGDAISTLTLASSSLSHAADTTLSLNEG
jgi:hypothetical protein